ncbi:unnamed protein product [Lymnaea stagnalis]|uniref:Uncharacterized protein n=1 Tax=Lymnaea stagnalis TaxID=6523 RepID=A0AAV2ILF2_LYMST
MKILDDQQHKSVRRKAVQRKKERKKIWTKRDKDQIVLKWNNARPRRYIFKSVPPTRREVFIQPWLQVFAAYLIFSIIFYYLLLLFINFLNEVFTTGSIPQNNHHSLDPRFFVTDVPAKGKET